MFGSFFSFVSAFGFLHPVFLVPADCLGPDLALPEAAEGDVGGLPAGHDHQPRGDGRRGPPAKRAVVVKTVLGWVGEFTAHFRIGMSTEDLDFDPWPNGRGTRRREGASFLRHGRGSKCFRFWNGGFCRCSLEGLVNIWAG